MVANIIFPQGQASTEVYTMSYDFLHGSGMYSGIPETRPDLDRITSWRRDFRTEGTGKL